ncbi:MAG: sulfatase-like hydrolase/transferase [Rhodospirillaceae bacterium]|nr:sulfatase-like hydrolase/transferase [Rhodospirillales bacterium]
MTQTKPNVLFITVDALRADRCSVYGYGRPTTPNLERLAQRALVCDHAYSSAAFTQGSFPTIMTSSSPLAHGGFDNGAVGRPPTVFQAFAESGYDVKLLSTFKWVTRYFGYGEGAEHEEHLYSPKGLMGTAVNRTKSTISLYKKNAISEVEMVEHVSPVFEGLFDNIEDFCQKRIQNDGKYKAILSGTNVMQDGFDFGKIAKVTAAHRGEFRANPTAYVKKYFKKMPEAHEWIAADWRYCRKPSRLVQEIGNRLIDLILGCIDKKAVILRKSRIKQFVDGSALADHVINTITGARTDRPFFIWTHFIDTHVPYLPGSGKNWWRKAPDLLAQVGHDRNLDLSVAPFKRPQKPEHVPVWSCLYDAAVRYVDEQIGRILDTLEATGLRDNTLVVFLSDHGEELGEHGNFSHYFTLYRHNTWVPMIFAPPSSAAGRRLPGMASLADAAPTMAGYCGVKAPAGWDGLDLSGMISGPRTHLVQESFYGGNCLFDKRPLYMAARSTDFSMIWKEYVDPDDRLSPPGPQLYDLRQDPLELANIYSPDHPQAEILERLIMQRMAEMPEIGADRVRANFPHLGGS